MIKMGDKKDEMRIIVAAISAVILSKESVESIKPSIGRETGDSWSISHRRMAIGKVPYEKFLSARSSRK